MKKNHQTAAHLAAMSPPDHVNVAMDDLAGTLREGLLALAVGAGLQVMQAVFDEQVQMLCGVKGAHDLERSAYRHGSEKGSVALGGRKIPVRRPRCDGPTVPVRSPFPPTSTSPPPTCSAR